MLNSQHEAAILRRKATERGFEVNVYVPLGLVERKQQQRRQLDEQRDRENVYELTQEVIVKNYEHDTFLQEVITPQPSGNNKHIAIIGEPGAGKTTLLSTIASFINKDNTQDLPIFISLANLQERTIEEYLLKQWLPEAMRLVKSDVIVTPEIERQLLACFGKQKVWLLLDGVDEMGENSPVQALAKINRELTASLRQARVVLTCRLNVWDAQINNTLTGFDTYKTQEFKPEQIDEFINEWFERAGNLAKGKTLQDKLKATQHENIRKLVTNPLRLSLLCQTFDLDKQGELPETKAALYQRFTRYFYEWKSALFPKLCASDDLKDKLHQALSKLAFAGINSSARFRLPSSLASQAMGERLFKLGCDIGWLNLVDRVAETEEGVYAFFHPNFQEYFAALNVNDWHEFLNHVPHNPAQGTYRIFEPQWREVILLWLGRPEENLKRQKQKFINALVNFKDGCGQWNRKDVDKGFYEYRAYFLAVVGIAEFKDCSQADEIVAQIIKWDFGYSSKKQNWVKFLEPIQEEARSALQQTERIRAIAPLERVLQSTNLDNDTRRYVAYRLGKIDPSNETMIASLVEVLQATSADHHTRLRVAQSEASSKGHRVSLFFPVAKSLERIGKDNEAVIAALAQLLQFTTVDEDTHLEAIKILGKIGIDNATAIAALAQVLQSSDVSESILRRAVQSLGEIAPGDETAIAALAQLLQSTTVDENTRHSVRYCLEKIGMGNKVAIAALVQLLKSPDVSDSTLRSAVESLQKIDPGNETVILALVRVVQSATADHYNRLEAFESLEKIDPGNEFAIPALLQLLQSTTADNVTRWRVAQSLEKIGKGNEFAIAALVEVLQSSTVDDTICSQATNILEKIGKGNEFAIASLVELLQSSNVDDKVRWRVAQSLETINPGNKTVITALEQVVQSTSLDDNNIRLQAATILGRTDSGNQIAINALVKLLRSKTVDNNTCQSIAYRLREISTDNGTAITILEQRLQFSTLNNKIRRRLAESLGIIDPGNKIAISALVDLLQSTTVNDRTREKAAYSLEEIGTGNEFMIATLEPVLQSLTLNNKIRRRLAESLGIIDPGNKVAISALVDLLQSTTVDDKTHQDAAYNLEKIGTGDEFMIATLEPVLQSLTLNNKIRGRLAENLGKIDPGNKVAISALVDLLQSTTVDDKTHQDAAYNLEEIGTGDEFAIASLVKVLESKTVDNKNRSYAASILGKIDPGNKIAISALMKVLESKTLDDDTREYAKDSLKEIGTGHDFAISALVQLMQSTTLDKKIRLWAKDSLEEIAIGNQTAISTLEKVLKSIPVNNSRDNDPTRWLAADSLWKINPGNKEAILALVYLLQTSVNKYPPRRAAESLEEFLQNNEDRFQAVKALSNYWQLDGEYYDLAWKCAQNMPYSDFYQAWHHHNFATRTMRSLKKILFTRII
ncbi:HEAT repeat domain-containing protein [Fortiea sp. LEGE XX443]|nr:HEAT repeat domain-containing protein [Fortiea sp. LEGE XX443]